MLKQYLIEKDSPFGQFYQPTVRLNMQSKLNKPFSVQYMLLDVGTANNGSCAQGHKTTSQKCNISLGGCGRGIPQGLQPCASPQF